MEPQTTKKSSNGKTLIVLGFIGISILFLIYSRYGYLSITPDTVPVLERMALAFYVMLALSFCGISYGLYIFHKQQVAKNTNSILSIIGISTYNRRSRQIFVVSFLGYGLFFTLTSGMLVYQPEVTFSVHYDATIPSAHITSCCGPPGYMPKIVVFFSEHVGLNIVPINLVLLLVVSYLVGLNFAIAAKALPITRQGGGLGSVGASTGLFIACPTCAGTILSLLVGGSAVALTIAIVQIQTILIAVSIPVLLSTPIIMARRIRKFNAENCSVDSKQ